MADGDLDLLNPFQRDFPLISRPFQIIADQLGQCEEQVLQTLRRLQQAGKVSRVGTVFATRCLGVSTLAALAVPPERLEAVAQWINTYPEVNHNYEREHAFNLWLVLTAASTARLQTILEEIGAAIGRPLLDLPLIEEFHIDLGFDLRAGQRRVANLPKILPERLTLSPDDQALLAALQPGLPLVARPYHALAESLGRSECAVLEKLRDWLKQGVIKRLGIIVRHRELGYRANAMVVWDIPDAEVSAVGRALAAESGVNLCYRRRRRPPHWRYNLFCMMHGRQRAEVLHRIEQVRVDYGLMA
ncbi:MAG: Lrp/AsnC family transcriptional regulator, partial [Candidatus Competibacteraceae bacterium]|nr:Lrp/AsnC family transcriptional regulator [Candidatus Competibacteraceae bacterium]